MSQDLGRGFLSPTTTCLAEPQDPVPCSSFSGVSDIQRCGHRLLPGGVEMASACSKRFVQMCDVGELWPSGLTGSFHF
ncbi:ZNF140 isoform 8 [Pan troglodytes]|uniref:ZNF140 isoform 8 n=1 Tax=Pan troglodytes TaxID=9598 RepID=A0A2J8IMG8_PANTR|nr:ZNF140 isoform 8 [Pan troglodytes]